MCAAQKEKKGSPTTTLDRQRESSASKKESRNAPPRLTDESEVEVERLKREVLELRRGFILTSAPCNRAPDWRAIPAALHSRWINLMFYGLCRTPRDRGLADDKALIHSWAKFRGRPVAIVGHQKGATPSSASTAISASRSPKATARPFGVMELARNLGRPFLTFMTRPARIRALTPKEAARRAIARNLREMSGFPFPSSSP